MDFRNRRAIHAQARSLLSASNGDHKNIALWYTVIGAVMTLGFSVFSQLLGSRIDTTGGLGNIGLRSILSTGQTLLPIVQLLITLGLNLGYHRAVLFLARQQEASPRTLLDGFRYFGPMLRAGLFQVLLYLSYGVLTLYPAATLFAMTPWAEPFNAMMEPYLNSASTLGGNLVLEESAVLAMAPTLVPMMWIWLGLFLLLFIPTYFSYRMSTFCIADNPRLGAFASLRKSKFLLRGNRFALFRLDLSLWWFYALQFLISALCYGDSIAILLGISLPWSPEFGFYFFFVLALIVQILVYYFLMNRVNVAYAVAFDILNDRFEEQLETARKAREEFTRRQPPFSTDY